MKKFLKIVDENASIIDVTDDYFKLYHVMRQRVTNTVVFCGASLNDIKFNSFGIMVKGQIYSTTTNDDGYPKCQLIEISEDEYLYLKDIIAKNSILESEESENDSSLEENENYSDIIEENLYENYKNSNDSDIMKFTRDTKIKEMKSKCKKHIISGIDVTLKDSNNSIEHFDLTLEDQINLNNLKYKITLEGMTNVEFHCKNGPFRYYSKNDILTILKRSDEHILYHNSYFNSLKQYIKNLNDYNQINSIEYGQDFPDEYKNEVLKSFSVSV